MDNRDLRVAVVGGGIVGICSALALLEAGHRVTLIERNNPGQGASFGNAGVISPWSIVPQAMPGIWKTIPSMLLRPYGPAGVSLAHSLRYLPWLARFLKEAQGGRAQANSDAMSELCNDAVTLYRQLLQGTGHEDLIADSTYIHAFRNAKSADPKGLGYRMRIERGAEIERIGSDELRRLEPALSHDFEAALLIKGQARARNPGKIGEVLAQKIVKLGGQLLRATVTDLSKTEDGWEVKTDNGEVFADKVVLAAGAWSPKLMEKFGVKVPLAAERGYHVSFENSGLSLNNSIMDVDGHAVASSMDGGLRVAGIAEFSGVDTPPNPRRIKTVLRTAISMFPDLEGQAYESWMGVRPSFPDSLPILDKIADQPGLIGAFGHSHYGLMMAPQSGRIVASLVSGVPLNIDVSPYFSCRF
jgi:D-amino-acid dehydrogenase